MPKEMLLYTIRISCRNSRVRLSVEKSSAIIIIIIVTTRAKPAQGPLTPTGGWTGVLVGEIPDQKSFLNLDQVAIWTPQMYGLSTPLGEAVLMAI